MTPTSKAVTVLILSVLAAAALVGLSSGYVSARFSDESVHITEAVIRFSGTDAAIDITYEAALPVELYAIVFGSRNLEGDIRATVEPLGKIDGVVIRHGQAAATVKGISEERGTYYLHDGRELGKTIDRLVLIYPDGRERLVLNTSKTPDTFYEAAPESDITAS